MPEWIERILDYKIIGIAAQRYLIAFVVLLAAFLVRKIVQGLLEKRFAKLAERTKTRIDDILLQALSKPISLAILLGGMLCAILLLGLPANVEVIVLNVTKVLFAALGTWLVFRLIDVFAGYFASLAGKTETKLDDQLIPLVRKTAKVFISVVAFVLVVQNLGYSVSGLLAGLGLGGLAFALAAKDTLATLFGSAAIFADRPFHVGDWIKTDQVEGVVEEVGFRSTRIRTFDKTLTTIPNSILANIAIDNFSARNMRRVKMTIGVTYDTTAGQMEKAVEEIKKILHDTKGVHPESHLVSFTDFGPSSLDILVYYFTNTTVYEEYLQVRQEVNLSIMRALEGMGLSIAFPSRTVYMQKT